MDERKWNNQIKYIFFLMLTMLVVFVLVPVNSVDAVEIIAGGKCGDSKVNDGEDVNAG